MTKEEFLKNITTPLPTAVLKKYPEGHIRQYWAENPELYSKAFGQQDDLHKFLGGHSGLDIATWHGDSVVAPFSGKVVRVKTDRASMGGIVAYIESPVLTDGVDKVIISCSLAHLDSCYVKEGDQVKQGQPIGTEGNTGFVVSGSTAFWGNAPAGVGTHLHFGLYEFRQKNGAWVRINETLGGSFDPLPWLTGDWSGTSILLDYMVKLLTSWSLWLKNRNK